MFLFREKKIQWLVSFKEKLYRTVGRYNNYIELSYSNNNSFFRSRRLFIIYCFLTVIFGTFLHVCSLNVNVTLVQSLGVIPLIAYKNRVGQKEDNGYQFKKRKKRMLEQRYPKQHSKVLNFIVFVGSSFQLFLFFVGIIGICK